MSVKVERAESMDNTCPVCHDGIEIFAIGQCDHSVCYRCSTRMRVLCEQMDCPICRSKMPQVAFVNKNMLFTDINLRNCIPNRKYKIFFEDEHVEDKFSELQVYRCKMCPNRGPDKTFSNFQTHMRREHKLFACDLCVKHLKIFPSERKFYSRKDLASHRRVGDQDDKSYKGHPLCEFCDQRYNDKDDLMRHLRKDHFFCHFCDQHGSNAYYDQYPDLRAHFEESHFLCTEGDCGNNDTRFTHAFDSEIDMKAHKSQVHSKNLSKAQAREARTIELDFHLIPRRQGNNRGAGITSDDYENTRSSNSGHGRGDRYNRRREFDQETADLKRAMEISKEESLAAEARQAASEPVPDPIKDFPSLNGATPVDLPVVRNVYIKPSEIPQEEFPLLSVSASSAFGKPTQAPTKAYSSVMNFQSPLQQAVPVKKDSKPVSLGSVAKVPKERWTSQAPRNTEDEYPALGGTASITKSLTSNANSANWLKKSQNTGNVTNVQAEPSVKSSSHRKSKSLESRTLTDEEEFPSLGNGKSGQNRNTGVFAKPFADSSKLNGSKKSVKSDRYDDDAFELPASYYKAYEESVSSDSTNTVSKEVRVLAQTTEPAVESAPVNTTSEFPGLPAREKSPQNLPVKERKKKKKNKKLEDKSTAKVQNKSVEDSSASLSDIARTLVQPGKEGNKDKTVKAEKATVVNSEKSQKPTDWFDNPPSNFLETPQPPVSSDEKVSSSRKTLPVEKSNFPPLSSEDSHNFPSLHTMSISVQQPKPPPGFSSDGQLSSAAKVASVSAPPGFKKPLSSLSSATSPPPGFTVNAVFIQPPDFNARNLKLIEDIREALMTIEDGFSNFKVLSRQFRQGSIDGENYYSSCQALMGNEDFGSVFPELLALLPDISKQHELWEVHQAQLSQGKRSDVLPISQVGSKTDAPWKNGQKLTQCPACGQVTLVQDIQHHQLQHTTASDFPALGEMSRAAASNGNEGGPGLAVKGAWIKAK